VNARAARGSALVFASTMLCGCAVGYNHVLFVTKSNVGLDIDTKPPTAEVSIARREGVIAPTFEKGQTPTVMASFRVGIKGLLGVMADVSSTFSGGDAAATMATLFGDRSQGPSSIQDSSLCLGAKPAPISVLGIELKLPEPGEVWPFVFGTDTSFGLKVAWSGLTAQVPDTVRIGYNRKEFAWAPVYLSPGQGTGCPSPNYIVKIPSFLATIDSSATAKIPGESGLDHLQYFATGVAANKLALREEIRSSMLKRLDPLAAARVERFQLFKKNQESQIESLDKIEGLPMPVMRS